jgi:endo-1,4-beta-xylanase
MFSLAGLVSILSLATAVVGEPVIGPKELQPRQGGGFTTQYWGNDFADFDYKSGPGGNFAVEWDNNFGGNFVVGKGYRPAREM